MRRIGILGGTFDPPHIGHLMMAEEARIQMNLDEVWWMPNKIPPHKLKKSNSSEKDRVSMVELMTELHESFRLYDAELKRSGPSYTVDTIKEIIFSFPKEKFYFIIGEDSLNTLQTWHKSEELQKLVSFIVIKRPGHTSSNAAPLARINLLESTTIDVSSTHIRAMIRKKRLNQFLLTKGVFELIKERQLYG